MLVGGLKHVVVFPVHLELADRVLVVVLVGLPAEFQHVVADLGDHVIAAHDRLLVVARLFGSVVDVRAGRAFTVQDEEFRLNPGLDAQPFLGRLSHQFFKDDTRRLIDGLAFHRGAGGDPGDVLLPRQLDGGVGVRHRHQIGMGRGQVKPGGETGETRAVLGHVVDRLRGDELRPLTSEEVGVGDHEILDPPFLGPFGKVFGHMITPCNVLFFVDQKPPLRPGIQLVPAMGTPAIAAASMVSAQRSSGSRL